MMFKNKMISIFLLVIFLVSTNGYAAYTRWEKDREINGVEFRKVRFAVKGEDTLAVIGYLKEDSRIDGYFCRKGWVHFSKNWELKLFQLDRETLINDFQYPEDTWIRFNDEGNVVCTFPKSTNVQGYLCKGGGGVKGVHTVFYQNGRLKSFFSDKDVLIDGIPCKGGILNMISLHENGKLLKCTLARETVIAGIKYNRNAQLSFDENGIVNSDGRDQ